MNEELNTIIKEYEEKFNQPFIGKLEVSNEASIKVIRNAIDNNKPLKYSVERWVEAYEKHFNTDFPFPKVWGALYDDVSIPDVQKAILTNTPLPETEIDSNVVY